MSKSALMDFFGTKKRRATQAAVDYVRPLIGTIQHIHGLPARFWMDDFVLGFIGFMIAITAKMAVSNLSMIEGNRVFCDAFTALSNQNGEAIASRAMELYKNPTPDFSRGHENATTIFLYFQGALPDEDSNPDAQAAKENAFAINRDTFAFNRSDSREDICVALIEKLFSRVIIDRFKLR